MITEAQASEWIVRGWEWPDDRVRWVEKIKNIHLMLLMLPKLAPSAQREFCDNAAAEKFPETL